MSAASVLPSRKLYYPGADLRDEHTNELRDQAVCARFRIIMSATRAQKPRMSIYSAAGLDFSLCRMLGA
jgi:hypothetical protein